MKRLLGILIPVLLIPVVAIIGGVLFPDRGAAWVSLCVAILACVPFLLNFEFQRGGRFVAREIAILAVLIGLSALGRFVFAFLPGFKPLAAVAILAGLYLGRDAGFLVGTLSVLISNLYFGQGPWTAFQMFAFGIVGFLAGALQNILRKNTGFTALYGAFAGVFFSLIMDIWSALWLDGHLTLCRYGALALSSLPFTFVYIISNVIFLVILAKPVGRTLDRLRQKYGVFR